MPVFVYYIGEYLPFCFSKVYESSSSASELLWAAAGDSMDRAGFAQQFVKETFDVVESCCQSPALEALRGMIPLNMRFFPVSLCRSFLQK